MSKYLDPAEESRLVEAKAITNVNGVGCYLVVAVGDQWIDVWDEHTKDEWQKPSYIRLMIPDTTGVEVGMKCHIRIHKLPEGL